MPMPKELEDLLASFPKGKTPKSTHVYNRVPLTDEEVSEIRRAMGIRPEDIGPQLKRKNFGS